MKIRNDFVSNSSSSSFIAFEPDKRMSIFSGMRNGKLNYSEFRANLDYYDSIVLKYDDEHKEVVDKFLEFVKNTEQTSIACPNDEYWAAASFTDYMHRAMWKLFDIKSVEKTEEESSIKKTFPWMKVCDYYYNGKKIDICNNDDLENTFKFKTNFRYVSLNSAIFNNGYCGEKNYILEPFIKGLSDTEFNVFLDSIVGMYCYVEGDEYGDNDTRPSELLILEKYN